jgi:hypothetical protein
MTEEPFHAFAFDGVLGLGPIASGFTTNVRIFAVNVRKFE